MDILAHESQIPVINIENIKPGTESWISTCHKVRHTLEEYGFFMIVSEGFSQDLKKDVYANSKTLFDLPIETKMKNTSTKPLHGYLGATPTRPLYESTSIDHPTSLKDVESIANLMWPSGNDQFSKTMYSYAKLVSTLENLVRKMVFESYGVAKYHESFSESVTHLLKLNKYRQPKSDENNLGIILHTDKDFLTILSEDEISGLENQIKDDELIGVEFLPSSLCVLAGDAFMAWSNGRTKSPFHRVIMKGQEDRYSITILALKKGIIEIPEELVDEEHPPRYKPFDHLKFLEFYAKHPSYIDQRAIESFCGNKLIEPLAPGEVNID